MRYEDLEKRVNALEIYADAMPEEDLIEEVGNLLNDIAYANAIDDITTEEMVSLAKRLK